MVGVPEWERHSVEDGADEGGGGRERSRARHGCLESYGLVVRKGGCGVGEGRELWYGCEVWWEERGVDI